MLRVSGAQKVLRLINNLYVQLITLGGSRFERKWMTHKMALLVSPVRLIKSWPEFSIFLALLIVNE